MLKDFQKFLLRGNLVDLAIGFTVGAAFTTVARSLVDDIIMPPIAALTGDTAFADKFILLRAGETPPPYDTLDAAQSSGAITLDYGQFLNNLFALLIVGLAMYLVIKLVNSLEDKIEGLTQKDKEEKKKDPDQKKCPYCLSTIPYKATRCPNCTSDLPKKDK